MHSLHHCTWQPHLGLLFPLGQPSDLDKAIAIPQSLCVQDKDLMLEYPSSLVLQGLGG